MSYEEPTNKELSTSARYLIRLCKTIIKEVKEGKCSEEEINDIIVKTTHKQNGYIDPQEYLNADKAMKYLGVHRNEFFSLLKKHKINVHKVNNQPIGYYIDDLKRIKKSIKSDT